MKCRFQFRRYRLPFRTLVRTGHGPWAEREGVLVRITAADDGMDAVGFGEAAPVPGFGMESVDAIVAACAGLSEWSTTDALLAGVPEALPTLRNAIATAVRQLAVGPDAVGLDAARAANVPEALAVAALLPAGRAALDAVRLKADAGFRVFKWKVGVADWKDEISLLDDVCAALPSGGKLRLDANGAWDRRHAERWLERAADRPVEFIEQPSFAPRDAAAGGKGFSKTDDLLLGLAADFPTPLALDESVVYDGDVARWLDAGWRGVFVIKPGLFGDLNSALARLAKARADVVFSSALETAVGAKAALQVAFAWAQVRVGVDPQARPRALGFGVWPLFMDDRCDGPYAAPFIRCSEVERLDAAQVWDAVAP